jgi:hypothetical protein
MIGNSIVAAQFAASQEGLSSMKLVDLDDSEKLRNLQMWITTKWP